MGSRECSTCGHVFFAHGPDGCRCGCTSVRGGFFRSDTPMDVVLKAMGLDEGAAPEQSDPRDEHGSSGQSTSD